MTFSDKIDQALKDTEAKSYAADYLAEVRTNWRDAERDLKRSMALILLSSFTFFFIGRGQVSEISLAGIKISDTAIVQMLLPAVVAYLITSVATSFMEILLYRYVNEYGMKAAYGALEKDGLETVLYPSGALFYSQARLLMLLTRDTSVERSLLATSYARVAIVLMAPVAFEVYSYMSLFSNLGFHRPLLWISLAVTFLLLANTALLLLATRQSGITD